MDLAEGAVDEAPHASGDGGGPGVIGARDDDDARVPEHLEGKTRENLQGRELARAGRVDDRLRREHVGTDRFDELAGVVEERRVEVTRGCRTQGGEHLLREGVDGRDRGRVEVGDGPFEATESALTIRGGNERQELVGGRYV